MPIMGCYGIGIERILTAAIESSAANEGKSYALPPAIAPFQAVVTITNVARRCSSRRWRKVALTSRPQASTSFWTTAMNAQESNSKTPTSSASPIESTLDAE